MSKKIKLSSNCYVDIDKSEVILDDERNELDALELKLLKRFIDNNGQYLTNDQLIDTCWGHANSADDSNLYVALKSLRNKIGDDNRQIIKNTRGLGYIINLPEQDDEPDNDKNSDLSSAFEADLRKNTKDLLENWEKNQGHPIDKDLLASCTVKGKDFESLYSYFKEAVQGNNDKNCVVQAAGGSGKTFSLVYTCKQFLQEKNDVIPIFIQMRKVDPTCSFPIGAYLYNNFVHRLEFETPIELEKQFIHNLGVFLKDSKKHLIIVLDGCNECPKEALSDLDNIASLPNTTIVASSRLMDTNMDDYYTIRLHSLDGSSTKKYLDKYNIFIEGNLYPENLRLPIFVYMYAQICKEKMDTQEKLSSLINQATIINDWITSDLNKHLRSYINKTDEVRVAVEYLLPLLAMSIYFDSDHEQHRSLSVTTDTYMKAIKEVVNLFEDDEFSTNLLLKNNIDVADYNVKKCIKLINDVAVSRFGFMQREEKDNSYFSWTHECYRDWFIAKGLDVLRHYSKALSDKYIEKLITDTFRYPRVFTLYKDYPSYCVALYYAELIGRDVLTSIDNPRYHALIRNIVFFADDLGDTDNVLEYSDCLTKRDINTNIRTDPFDKALALSGTAYSMLHIYNLDSRDDWDSILSNAFDMLTQAKDCTEEILKCDLSSYDIQSDKIMSLTPKELNKYHEEHLEEICSRLTGLKELEEAKGKDHAVAVLALYARIFGNLCGYYMARYDKNKDRKELIDAHKMNLLGSLVKYYILKKTDGGKIEGRSDEHAMSIAYRSFGTDLLKNGQYELSMEFYRYALNNFDIPQSECMLIKAAMLRSMAATIGETAPVNDINKIHDLLVETADYFKANLMVGQLERLTGVLTEVIIYCKNHTVSDEIDSVVTDTIEYLDKIFTDMSLDDDLKTNMMSFYKGNGKNIWKSIKED